MIEKIMMKSFKTLGLVCALAVALAAFNPAALARDFGPMPVNYEESAESYIESRLSNARGARVQVLSAPYQVYSTLAGYDGLPCWAVDVRVRARLASGGYGSYQRYTVLFHDGEAIALKSDARKVTRAEA
ncbi:MAG: hypothetical protein AAF199_01245 [Pseudomonadota bacterium]